MGYNIPDPYNQPERFGLTVVGDIEWSNYAYEFNMTVVWRDSDGTVYWADDSGCSCPSPFEDVTTTADLNKGTKWDALAHLQSRADGNTDVDTHDYANLAARVAAL
jgi:hypothetical protein